MIVFLRGRVFDASEGYMDVDVQGVGYRVWIPERLGLAVSPEQEIFLYTHQHIREDANDLYGFETIEERACFELLLGVSGIGPKGAMQIVSSVMPGEFAAAVLSENVAYLQALPGIGKKTAQRLILELRDKVQNAGWSSQTAETSGSKARKETTPYAEAVYADVVDALRMLGYADKVIVDLVPSVLESRPQSTVEEALRECLKQLDRPGLARN